MTEDGSGDGWGCGGCIAAILVIGAVAAAVISIAALIDPFSWMPPVGDIWADCQDDYATAGDECELASRYQGFWVHALVNFAYVVGSAIALVWLARAVLEIRDARVQRFSGDEAVARCVTARGMFALACCVSAALGGLPILVAVL